MFNTGFSQMAKVFGFMDIGGKNLRKTRLLATGRVFGSDLKEKPLLIETGRG